MMKMMTKHSYTSIALALALLLPAQAQAQKTQRDTTLHGPWDQTSTISESASGAVSVYQEDLEKSPSVDLRAMLTGRIPGLEVIENGQPPFTATNLNNPWLTNGYIAFAGKGYSSIACIVDDMQLPFAQFLLDPNQIESITFVSEVADKAALSPWASTGALYIKTKKGQYDSPLKVTVTAESGVGFVDKMPEWVDGEDYAKLNNQARAASGYPVLYSPEAIKGFAQGDPLSREYPSVDYKSLMYKNFKPQTKIGVNLYGGSSNVKYNFSINGLNDGDIYKVGPVADFNKINITSSVTARINKWIEANVNFMGMLAYRRGNQSSLTAYRNAIPVAFPVALGYSTGDTGVDADKEGMPIYAVSRQFTNNPYAKLVDGGFYLSRVRTGNFNANLSLDLGWLLPGLKSKTMVNFGSSYLYSVGKDNDYLAYYWDSADDVVDLSAHLGVKASSKSILERSSFQTTNIYERLSYDWAKDGHKLAAAATYYQSSSSESGRSTYDRVQYATATAKYSYASKYIAEVVLQYAGATMFAPEVRYALFPTVALGWVASNEDFLKSSGSVDYLKFHAQVGQIGSSDFIGTNYLYNGDYSMPASRNFGPATAYQWFGSDKMSANYSKINRLANPQMTWPKIFQVDLGVNLSFKNGIDLWANGFFMDRTGNIANTMEAYLSTYGWNDIAYYENYTASRAAGYEVGAGYRKDFGDFGFNLKGWAIGWKQVHTKVVTDNYLYDWQKVTGSDASAMRGYVCIGKFTSQDQIDRSAKYDQTGTKVGDLMYEDLNEDGKIDSNDQKIIGNSMPRLRYNINLNLHYKNLELDVVGNGRAFYDVFLNNAYFWNGWGDGNYSAFVRDNLGGAYPSLSYVKNNNNFINSDFWMRKGGFFKIQSVELAYNLKLRDSNKLGIEGARFSLRGGNLLTLTGLEYVDPESRDAGVTTYPYFKTVTAGVKLTF